MFNENIKIHNENKQKIEDELKQLKTEKTKAEFENSKILKLLHDLDNEILNQKKNFNDMMSKNEIMIIGSDKGFNSERQKREFIQNEINKLIADKNEINTKFVELSTSITNDDNLNKTLIQNIEAISNETNNLSKELRTVNEQILEFKKKRFNVVNDIKKLDLEINELNEEAENAKDNIKSIERLIPNFELLSSCRKIKENNFSGCYGILLDFLDIEKKFKNPIDIIAKDKLYSIIVNNIETANKILEYNKSINGPVISILPLDWNKEMKNVEYPHANDAYPLLNSIKINENKLNEYTLTKNDIAPILNKIFGKCILVKSYDVGIKYASLYNLNCISPENEIIYSGGYVTRIGYYDYQRQRLTLYEELNENKSKLESIHSTKEKLENERLQQSNYETKLLREGQSLVVKKNEITYKIQEFSKEQEKLAEEQINIKEIISSKKSIIDNFISDRNSIDQRLSNYSEILNNPSKDISAFNNSEINSINQERVQIEKKLVELEKVKINLQTKYNELVKNLDYINKKEVNCNAMLNEINVQMNNIQSTDALEENDSMTVIENNIQYIEELKNIKEKYKADFIKAGKEIESSSNELIILKQDLNKFNERISKEEAELKQILLSIQDVNDKKDHTLKSLGNLGTVNMDALYEISKNKHQQLALINNESSFDIRDPNKLSKILEPVIAKLESLNKKMKKFDKINRFAVDDYKVFKNKKEEIKEKLDELYQTEEDIKGVISVLDDKKESAIQSTFEKVKKSFEYIFKEMVPNGHANLTLENLLNTQSFISDSNSDSTRLSSYSQNGKAISINVSFTGNINASQSMNQLSGGQKTAVAVALIFALSKIDLPPFYILDEIDAALDPSMRHNLAKLITSLSEHNQFIISTFKPEILDVSNNIYGVKFVNKSSNLAKISKEEATKFIKEVSV
jgi:structural maintenance of chromosome 3 (chondroitin sulfate proteoglycan 6)